jgi:ribosomal protein S18 acetylase RimI-like enzyme
VIVPDTAHIAPSDYYWANFEREHDRIGKARLRTGDDIAYIYSIMIYTQYRGHGYASAFIRLLKREFTTIVADRVRPEAVGFWRRKGFTQTSATDFIWKNNKSCIHPYKEDVR